MFFASRAGPGAVNYILDHAEIDVVFVQDKKVKQVSTKHSDFALV